MEVPPEKVVADIGKQLAQQSRLSKDFIVKSLKQAEGSLSKLEQLSSLKPCIKPFSESLVKYRLLHHTDQDVKQLVAVCLSEIIRVLAPDPSFDDRIFKDVFKIFIGMFMELADTASPYFLRSAKILETVAALECFRRMLDIGCEDLIVKTLSIFFSVVREEHQRSLVNGMLSIMTLLLNEGEISQPLLEVILQNLTNKGEGVWPASYHLAVALIQNCEDKLRPVICGFLTSCIVDGENMESELKEYYHEIICEIFQCAPQMLLAIIPNIVQELLTDQVDVRIKSVNLLGKLLILPQTHAVHEHHHLFIELLKRFSDKSAEVRINAIRAAKACYLCNPSGTDALKILSSLEGRLLDFDASVRKESMLVLCDLALFSLKNFPEEPIARVADRLRDKMASVKKEALKKLLEVYRHYCEKCSDGEMTFNEYYEQIPCKIMMLCYDSNMKDFSPRRLELLLEEDLFPASLPMEDRTLHWIFLYSLFTPAHVKVLNLVLCRKKRFQTEMRSFLSLRQKAKEKGVEENERMQASIRRMSVAFPNPVEAEERFNGLNQVKDNSIFDSLLQLLDEPAFMEAKTMRDRFLRKIGNKYTYFEFLASLSLRCLHNIFSSEHVRCILEGIPDNKSNDDSLKTSSLQLLLDITSNFPLLLRGSENLFKMLLLKEDSPLCEKLVQILAKAGPFISTRISDIYPFLERLSLEGTRVQSKAAVSAISALVGPSEQYLLLDLSEKLVESLHSGRNVPTVLQSLGCIAQHSADAFQKQEKPILSYINRKLVEGELHSDAVSIDEKSGCSISIDCKMKIYGLKALVKGLLVNKGDQGRKQFNSLLDILSNVIQKGEFPDGSLTSEDDKAHIRLAGAKSVLKLSRWWDLHMPPCIFQLTVMLAKDSSSFVRRLFLDKTHKLLKERVIPSRYACAFSLASSESLKNQRAASFSYLVEFIKDYSRAAQAQPTSVNPESMTKFPAYIVVFLIYVLAHDTEFPPRNCQYEELYVQFCRPLVFTVRALVDAQYVDGDLDVVNNTFFYLLSVFRAIKRAEDAVDLQSTRKLQTLADIGISILNALKHDHIKSSPSLSLVLLPSSLYGTSLSEESKEIDCHQTEFIFSERFAKKLISVSESEFRQVGSTTIKHGRKGQRNSSRDRGTSRLTVPKAAPLQDDRCIIEDLQTDVSGNFEPFHSKEHIPVSKSSVLGPSEIESDISTQDVDPFLSAPTKDNRKRKHCGKSATTRQSSCSKGSLNQVSLPPLSEREGHCAMDSVKEITTNWGFDATEGRGTCRSNVLSDRTNAVTATGLKKHFNQKKSHLKGHKISADTSVSDVTDVNEDVIAFRTRRRKV